MYKQLVAFNGRSLILHHTEKTLKWGAGPEYKTFLLDHSSALEPSTVSAGLLSLFVPQAVQTIQKALFLASSKNSYHVRESSTVEFHLQPSYTSHGSMFSILQSHKPANGYSHWHK